MATTNPVASEMTVSVLMPQTLEIKLVDSKLANAFELWIYLSGLTFGAVVGFYIAYLSSTDDKIKPILGWNTLVFVVLLCVFFFVAMKKRVAMNKESKQIKFALGNPIQDSPQ